jgi:hypothetical protein
MNGVGIGSGLIGSTTVIAIVYMMERGFKWWQIALVVLVSVCVAPHYRFRKVDE